MVTLAQRIEELRTARGLSRPAAAAALGFPKGAFEKFETGRQTPTKDQQEKMANYFGVSLFYLRGESSDPTRQEDWMSGAVPQDEPVHVPTPAPRKAQPSAQPQGTVMDTSLFSSLFRWALTPASCRPCPAYGGADGCGARRRSRACRFCGRRPGDPDAGGPAGGERRTQGHPPAPRRRGGR